MPAAGMVMVPITSVNSTPRPRNRSLKMAACQRGTPPIVVTTRTGCHPTPARPWRRMRAMFDHRCRYQRLHAVLRAELRRRAIESATYSGNTKIVDENRIRRAPPRAAPSPVTSTYDGCFRCGTPRPAATSAQVPECPDRALLASCRYRSSVTLSAASVEGRTTGLDFGSLLASSYSASCRAEPASFVDPRPSSNGRCAARSSARPMPR